MPAPPDKRPRFVDLPPPAPAAPDAPSAIPQPEDTPLVAPADARFGLEPLPSSGPPADFTLVDAPSIPLPLGQRASADTPFIDAEIVPADEAASPLVTATAEPPVVEPAAAAATPETVAEPAPHTAEPEELVAPVAAATTAAPTVPEAAPPEKPPASADRSRKPEVMMMDDKIRLARVLLTNDDGIDAAGLAVLAEIAEELADEVWIVAPEHDQSGTAMSLALHHPRRVFPRGRRRYAVSGSPADCVALATHLMQDERPQLLLSGINVGQNTGDDTNLSGTLGAALTGLMLRIPAIGISQCFTGERRDIRWEAARAHLPHLLQSLLHQGWRKETVLSINIPDLPPEDIREAVWTRQAQRTITGMRVEKRLDLRGFDYYWLNLARPQHDLTQDDTDIAALQRGQIAISCIGLDRSRETRQDSITLPPVE